MYVFISGTITPDGKGDVFSYAEDAMVEDPYLKEHLAHFGIKIQDMEKTDKSMAELEIDMNQKYGEWATLCESQSKLEPICGPGYTGMENLGNTCYMNRYRNTLYYVYVCTLYSTCSLCMKQNFPPTFKTLRLFSYPLGTNYGNYQHFSIKWSFRRNFQTLDITLKMTFIVIVKV